MKMHGETRRFSSKLSRSHRKRAKDLTSKEKTWSRCGICGMPIKVQTRAFRLDNNRYSCRDCANQAPWVTRDFSRGDFYHGDFYS